MGLSSKYIKSRRGAMAIFLLTMLSILVLSGLSLFELQQASSRDVHHSHSLAQARFLAQSALQEARYFAVRVDPSWTGTSQEQLTPHGSYEYVTTRNIPTSTYNVVATGYVPNKSDHNSVKFSFSSSFKYNPIPIGIVVTESSAKSALQAIGSSELAITATGGRVVVNSNHSAAVLASGGSTITVPELSVVGGISTSGGSTIVGDVLTGQDPHTDPLGWLPQPVQSDYTTQSSSVYSVSSGVVTINPGVYIGGISVSGSAQLTMNPGVYYLKDGGLETKNTATVTGSEVMIYNDPSTTTQSFDFKSTGAISLTPPTSGDYAGILFYQRRNATTATTLTANSNTEVYGAFYTRDGGLDIVGQGATTAMGTAYVVKSLKVSGGGSISIIDLPEEP